LVTFALFAYNQERYIEEAVAGAFAQDYSPLQIILSDDCSSDSTFEIMQRMAAEYQGPHKIVLNRNERNLGIGGHVTTVFSLAAGEIVVMAAGDDLSRPNRTTRCVETFQRTPGALAFISGFDYFDSDSNPVDGLWRPRPQEYSLQNFARGLINVPGTATAWHRSLINGWPSLSDVIHEDRVLPFRAMLLGGTIASLNEPLVTYRSAGGISRFTRVDSRNNPREMRIRALRRILPDALKRLEDYKNFSKGDRNLKRYLEKEISLLNLEISALQKRWVISDVNYMYIYFYSMRGEIIRKYVRVRIKELMRKAG
ncbi:MAG: glycosyltransferase, partial [Brucella intermedia]